MIWSLSLSLLSAAFGCIAGLLYWRRIGTAFKWLTAYLLTALLVQASGYVIALYINNNLLLYNVATPVYYVLISMVFCHLIKNDSYKRRMQLLFGLGLIVLLAVHFPPLLSNTLGTRSILVSSTVVVGACLLHLRHMLRNPSGKNPFKQPHFVLVMGFFLYHLGSFAYWCVMLLSIIESKAAIALMQRLLIVTLIPSYLIMGTAIVLEKRR